MNIYQLLSTAGDSQSDLRLQRDKPRCCFSYFSPTLLLGLSRKFFKSAPFFIHEKLFFLSFHIHLADKTWHVSLLEGNVGGWDLLGRAEVFALFNPTPTRCGVEANHRPTVVTYLLGQQCWWSWWAPGSGRGGFSQFSQVLKFFSVRVRDQRPRVLLEGTLDLQTASWMCPEITSWVKTRLPFPKPHLSSWTTGSKFLPLLWHWCVWPQARH